MGAQIGFFCCRSPFGHPPVPSTTCREAPSPHLAQVFFPPTVAMCLQLHSESHSWPIFFCFDFPFSALKRNASEAFFNSDQQNQAKPMKKQHFLNILSSRAFISIFLSDLVPFWTILASRALLIAFLLDLVPF